MIKELVDKLTEQVNDEATQKDWCSTELSKNEQSRTTLADDASNLRNLEDPMMQFAVNEQSDKFAPLGSIKAVLHAVDKMLVALVEEEKDDVIERNLIIELEEKFYIKFAQFERFEKERDRNLLLHEIVDEKLEDRFLERAGFECAERRAVRRDLEKLGQNLNDVHMAEIFSPFRATAESHRFGFILGMVFDIRTGWNLDDPRELKQLWEYLRTERPMLIIGSSECKAISNLQSLNRDSPNSQRA